MQSLSRISVLGIMQGCRLCRFSGSVTKDYKSWCDGGCSCSFKVVARNLWKLQQGLFTWKIIFQWWKVEMNNYMMNQYYCKFHNDFSYNSLLKTCQMWQNFAIQCSISKLSRFTETTEILHIVTEASADTTVLCRCDYSQGQQLLLWAELVA